MTDKEEQGYLAIAKAVTQMAKAFDAFGVDLKELLIKGLIAKPVPTDLVEQALLDGIAKEVPGSDGDQYQWRESVLRDRQTVTQVFSLYAYVNPK